MMKILSLVPYKIFPPVSGGQKCISLFNSYLGKKADLTCIALRSDLPNHSLGYRLLNKFPDSRLRYINPTIFFPLRKLIQREKISHLIIEQPYFGWLGVLLQTFTGAKLIVHSHNIENIRWKGLGKWWWRGLYWYERWTHRHASTSLFITEEDRLEAISTFGLDASKCITITYGVETDSPTDPLNHSRDHDWLTRRFGLPATQKVILFNGAFNYAPNLHGLLALKEKVNPLLQKQNNLNYTILVCGKGIPASLTQSHDPNFIFAGFVENIEPYFSGADLFLNPITEGGGIKTKLVEALGHGLTVVSSRSGATGVRPEDCGGKLLICEDGDWKSFALSVEKALSQEMSLPLEFYKNFFWGNIIDKLLNHLEDGPGTPQRNL
jgi:polysaccharide biosynthesis protein PslH